jgi:hypothetical protein
MPDFSFLPAYIAAFFHSWFSAMSGFVGVVAFVAGLVTAVLRRPLAFGSLITLAAVAIVIGGYDAWRSEYIKNIGDSFFRFHAADANEIGNESFHYSINIQNNTGHSVTLEDVSLVRIWISDTLPFQKITTNALQCKVFVTTPPAIAKRMNSENLPNLPQRWYVSGRPDVWYEFMNPSTIKMDDAPKSDFNTILPSGMGHIFSVSAAGQKIDRSQFADVILCPIVSFSTHIEQMTLICPGAAQGKITNASGSSQSQIVQMPANYILALPPKESPCKML